MMPCMDMHGWGSEKAAQRPFPRADGTRTEGARRPRRRRATALAGSLAATAMIALTCTFVGPPASADVVPPIITVEPATTLADGQAFTVRVEAVPGTTVINSGFCHPDMPAP